MVLPRFVEAARNGHPLKVFGDGQQTRCFCYVLDVVEALLRLQNCPAARGEVFNIGGTEEVSMLDLAKLVLETLASQSVIELVPYVKAYGPGFEDMRRRKPIVTKLENAIGFRPATSLSEIIRLTAGLREK
jgi:UDP-glucose 4-epimerase